MIEFVLVVLVTAACFQAANRAPGYARRFWRLMGVAFGLYVLAKPWLPMTTACSTDPSSSTDRATSYFFSTLRRWPSRFSWQMTARSRAYTGVQRWLDFLQIGIVSLSAYFFFL